MVANRNAGLVNVEIDGIERGMTVVPQCYVCGSKYRYQIEAHLAEGRTHRAIATLLPPDADLTVRNISDHYSNGHLDLDAPAVHRVSREQGKALGAMRQPLVLAKAAHLGFAHRVLGRVMERLETGELEPEIRDGIAAARLIAVTEAAATDRREIDEYVGALLVVIETMRQVVSSEQYATIGAALASNPVLRELTQERQEE